MLEVMEVHFQMALEVMEAHFQMAPRTARVNTCYSSVALTLRGGGLGKRSHLLRGGRLYICVTGVGG